MKRIALMTMLAAAIGCGGTSGSPSAPAPVAAPSPSALATPVPATGAKVWIAFYEDEGCRQEVGRRLYDTAHACFSWFAAGSNAQENSANRFQCWSDRLCYTQHPDSTTCAGGLATDKQARNGQCLKEPAGRLYSMLISGNESCPPPPPGFECPLSAPGAGTR